MASRKRFFFFILFLILSACTTPTAGGFDPNLAAAQAQLTEDAAAQNRLLFGVMATGTAQAPIIAITQTAAGLIVQQTQSSVNSTATAAQWTQTATPVPSMTPSPTPNATMTVVFANVYAIQTQTANKTERDNQVNYMKALSPYVVGLLLVIVGLMYALVHVKRLAHVQQESDEHGKTKPVLNVVEGIWSDGERSTNGVVQLTSNFIKSLPGITAERQDKVTERSQMVDMAARARMPKRLADSQSGQLALPAPVQLNTNFLLPSWNLIDGWDGKNGIPYYTARGLETIDIDQHPHLSVLGITGSGKSRRFARPVIACALAAGHRVVILGKSTDYWPFEDHPNATLLKVNKFTDPGQAARYAQILQAIVIEMNRRDDVLTSAHRSTWTHAGRNRTWIVLDEFGNALRLMDKSTSTQCRLWVEGLVAEGRKVGFNLMIANQRATGMPAIFSQTGKAIFRIEKDEERAHHSLAGASMLSDGYYLAKFGASKIAGAFEPSDEELRQFLASRPVQKLESEDEWIDAIATDVPPTLPASGPQESLPSGEKKAMTVADFLQSLNEQEYKVVEMYLAQSSLNEIQRVVYGSAGGGIYNKVKAIIERYEAFTSTTTTSNTPVLGPVPA
jgi:hypothetical protein